MQWPLVTVVCVCYNHERFVEEALRSVIDQTYANLQIIVLDDGSSDQSVERIKSVAAGDRLIEYALLENNVGYCKAFNSVLSRIRGEFFIDFAADDVMMPDRIEKQVRKFQSLDGSFGVVFTDAVYVDENGFELRHHYEYLFRKKLLSKIPEGYIYKDILERYFIAAPTMLVRTQVILDLNGYDESLSFEDFDFWVRSATRYQYAFLDQVLTRIRKSAGSMSTGLYLSGNKLLHDTYVVCRKAQVLNRNAAETNALAQRVRYELRQCVLTSNHVEAALFFSLLEELKGVRWIDRQVFRLGKSKLPLRFIRQIYHRIRFS